MPGKSICVLGMHRSGTSATTGMLQLLGVELGEHLMAGHDDVNALGYFEHVRIQDLNKQLLDAFTSSWDSVLPVNCTDRSESVERLKRRLLQTIRKDFGKSDVWALKDPRICRLLPVWKELFTEAQVEPRYLHTVRHPLEVAASLAKRDGFSTEKSCCLWLDHVLGAERETRGTVRTFVTYEALMADPVRTAEAIGHHLGVEWPNPVFSAAGSLRTFISSGLRHHKEGGTQGKGQAGPWEALAVILYDAIAQAGSDGPSEEVWDGCSRSAEERRHAFDPVLVEQLRAETALRIRVMNRNMGIRNSLSWKLLAPLRAVQRLFGGPAV